MVTTVTNVFAGVRVDVDHFQRRRTPVGDESHGRHREAVGYQEAWERGGEDVPRRTNAPGGKTLSIMASAESVLVFLLSKFLARAAYSTIVAIDGVRQFFSSDHYVYNVSLYRWYVFGRGV